jgi:Arc/MetJ-type ribon-helix-helix transcriptional regulator
MRQTLTISLPVGIKKVLDKAVKDEGVSYSDLIRESLREYLFIRRFRTLRAKMTAKAQKQGILSDEDVFALIS